MRVSSVCCDSSPFGWSLLVESHILQVVEDSRGAGTEDVDRFSYHRGA